MRPVREISAEEEIGAMNPDREIDAATDHPRAFTEAILDYMPTISKSDKRLSIEFDEAEQATEALDLLWAAIDSMKPASTEKEEQC